MKRTDLVPTQPTPLWSLSLPYWTSPGPRAPRPALARIGIRKLRRLRRTRRRRDATHG